MKEQNKQYVLSGLGWINILVITPLFFFTMIYNARVYAYRVHTEESTRLLLAYISQVLVLLSFLITAIMLQLNIKREMKKKVLTIVTLESVLCLIYSMEELFIQHQNMRLYGGVLRYFMTSYMGVALFVLNIVAGIFYFSGLNIKQYVTKFIIANIVAFAVCLTCINFIK